MLLLGEQDFAASGHDSLDANSLVMVTLRQATSGTGRIQLTRFITPRSPVATPIPAPAAASHLRGFLPRMWRKATPYPKKDAPTATHQRVSFNHSIPSARLLEISRQSGWNTKHRRIAGRIYPRLGASVGWKVYCRQKCKIVQRRSRGYRTCATI